MKTIATTFTLLFCGAFSALAGNVWHPGLGDAPAGQVYIGADAQTYQFETTNGTELIYEPGAMRQSLNAQLAADGTDWVTVSEVRSDVDEQFTVVLSVAANPGGGLRSAYFGTDSRRLELIQRGRDDSGVRPDIPDIISIIPGSPTDIELTGSNFGVWYSICSMEGDQVTTVASMRGTGGPITFRNVYFEPGEYWIENVLNSDFTVEFLDTFYARFATDESLCEIDADGEAYYVYFDRFTTREGREIIVTEEDDLFIYLEGAISELMSGISVYWDTKMRLTYGYDAARAAGYIRVVCSPNLSEETRCSDSFLLNRNGEHICFEQPGYGKLRPIRVSYDIVGDMLYATVPETQWYVDYRLMRAGTELAAGTGNGKDLLLKAALADGEYVVLASYDDGDWSDEIELNGLSVQYGKGVSLSDDRNWIMTKTFTGDGSGFSDVVYYDGLGYPRQTVAMHAIAGGDLVQQTEYDCWHRERKQYLPSWEYNNYGGYVTDYASQQDAFYRSWFEEDVESMDAFTENLFENSPLDRQRSSCAPGRIYRDSERMKRYIHDFNAADRVWRIDADADGSIRVAGRYPKHTLFYDVATDEDSASTITYTDKTGHAVLQSNYSRIVYDDGCEIDTYFVYDALDRLVWVITPEGSALLADGATHAPDSDFARKYCYTYEYDGLGRIVGKRLPGREAEYTVYDAGDRPVMTQDGNQRVRSEWRLCRYDALGRVLAEYLVTTPDSRETLQASFDEHPENPPAYALATGAYTVSEYMYDTYPLSSALLFAPVTGVVAVSDFDPRTKGLKTAESLAVIEGDAPQRHLSRAFYYDHANRIVQTVQTDPYGGVLRTSFRYDFSGNVLKRHERFTAPGIDDALLAEFTYDDRGRLLTETARLNDGAPARVEYTYNELGQLAQKRYGSGNSAVYETFEYNIQGWTTAKNSALFSMRLRYYDPQHGASAKYAGTIAEWEWQHRKTVGSADDPAETYAYTYDRLNRLTKTEHLRDGEPVDSFRETDFAYDRNGNIRSFVRFEAGATPKTFTFAYDGNLRTTADEGYGKRNYTYDANGNVTFDPIQYLEVYYNFLNLPVTINDSEAIVRYTYLADGTKFTVGDYDCTGYAYRGSLVYNQMFNEIGDLESAAFGSGRIKHTTSGQQIGYHLTDHLGSVRAIVADNSGVVSERNDYHAFGATWEDAQKPQSSNRYKFSGKEHSLDGFVPYLDFGARFYDPQSLLWLGPDPLAEKYYPVTPYAYCAGNPIRFIDPDGKKIVDSKGNEVWTKKDGWTNNAPQDTQKIGNAMMLTKTGTNIWEQMSASSAVITISLSPKKKYSEEGGIILGIADTKIKGGQKTVKIEILEGSINEFVRQDKTYLEKEKQEMMQNSSSEERIGAVATHEGTHAIDDKIDENRETRADANEKAYLKEVELQKPIVNPEILKKLF